MNALFKFIIVMCLLAGILSMFLFVGSQIPDDETRPKGTMSYEDVVPRGFSVTNIERVLDPRDADRIMQPSQDMKAISNSIVSVCETQNQECYTRAIIAWTRAHIEHQEVIQERDHILTPEETLLFRAGDDLALSVFIISLLRAQGIDAQAGRTPYSTFVQANVHDEQIRIDMGCTNCAYGSARYRGEEQYITWIG